MKNILRVFKNDLNKIHNNVIAMIVIMGILVIPTLYAWFNIAASWDPYGSTDGLKIAVASEDAGYTSELINVDLNLGDDVIKALKEMTISTGSLQMQMMQPMELNPANIMRPLLFLRILPRI